MRVHVLQIGYGDEEPVADRIDRVAELVSEQDGADLIVLPELWAPTGMGYPLWAGNAEPMDGPTLTAMASAAKAAGAYLHAGSIIEQASSGSVAPDLGEQGRGRWNTSAFFSPDGDLLASYRKIHRFGFAGGEPQLIEAGTDLVTVDVEIDGATRRLGLATCYDLRFPEMFRQLLDAGSEVFVVPAAWPAARVEHWTLLGRARAIENQCVMVQCNTAGTHGGVIMGGHSQIISATGEVLAEAGIDQEVLVADLDLSATHAWRERFPVLADRRL
jgi:predicted amidohydrolase